MLICLVNIWAVPPASTTPQALRFCSGGIGFVTGPMDTPANTKWLPGLQYPYHIKREIFGSSNAGSSRTNSGDIVLVGMDSRLDIYDCLDWGFDGQKIEVFIGDPTQPFTNFVQVFRGVCESVNFSWQKVTLNIRDRQQELDKPIPLIPKYLGTNAGTTGIEGGPDDLQGKFKPLALGPVLM